MEVPGRKTLPSEPRTLVPETTDTCKHVCLQEAATKQSTNECTYKKGILRILQTVECFYFVQLVNISTVRKNPKSVKQ